MCAVRSCLLFGFICGCVMVNASPLLAQYEAPIAERAYQRIASGVVVPNRETVVSAKIVGRIQSIAHDEGVRVSQGEVLIKLEDAEWRADLQAAQASVALAAAELNYRRTQRARLQDLRQRKSISQDALDSAILAVSVAEANISIARANVVRAEVVLKEAQILAPFDALIISKQTEVGEVTSPGAILMELQDQSLLKLRIRVKEKDVPHIAVGQQLPVTIDALGDLELQGTVSKMIPAGDSRTHTFLVEIDLPPHTGLYAGMYGQASF
jgi:RND family efflux transporter MFP subunit